MRQLILGLLMLFPTAVSAQTPEDTGRTAMPADTMIAAALTAEAVICSAVKDRMPVDTLDEAPATVEEIFCWSRITGADDSTGVVHLWLHQGEERARVNLSVRSDNWRTWSSKNIRNDWIGPWEVRILDAAGEVLTSEKFTVRAVVGDTVEVVEDTATGSQ